MPTPFMSLSLPTVSVTAGPEWASQLNTALTKIDAHDHSSGNGVRVTPTGLNINADLEFNSQNATELRSVRMDNNGSALVGVNDLRCIYVSGNNLFYNNGVGTAVQITSGAGLNAASIGGIGGDYATSSASVSYANSNKTFTFWQSANTSAHIDVGNVVIREAAASANGITVKSPTSLSSGYNWIFPTGLPGSGTTKILTIDSSGQVGAQYDADDSTIEVSSNTLRVKDSGITTAKINDLAVTTGKLASGVLSADATGRGKMADGFLSADATGRAKMADGFVTRAKIEALGQQVSSSSGTHTITTTEADITNLTVTITTTGRPVFVGLKPFPGAQANLESTDAAFSGKLLFLRDASTVAVFGFGGGTSSSNNYWLSPGQYWIIDTPTAGTYTYKVRGDMIYGSVNVEFFQLIAFEF